MNPIQVHIRWMIARDLPEVLANEEACQEWDAWNEEEMKHHLRKRLCVGMIAEIGDKVVGHMLYLLKKNHLELIRFAVHPDYWGRSIGWQMVDKLKSKLSPKSRHFITLTIPESETRTIRFFANQDFFATGLIKGDEDVQKVEMVYAIPVEIEA